MNALELSRQLPRRALARREATTETFDLQMALAFEVDAAILGRDPQLLLGVLALLGPAQLLFDRGGAIAGRRLLGFDQLGYPSLLILGLAQARLQARHVGLERAHGRLGRL